MTQRSKVLNRRALFRFGAGALGAAAVAFTGRGGAAATDIQALQTPGTTRHRQGNVACPCPICSGAVDAGRRANA